MTIGVYDSYGAVVESTNVNYLITLSLDPIGSLYGTASKGTTSGVAVFGSLRILSNGSFRVIAQSTGLASVQTNLFSITNYVHTITLSSSNLSPSVNFDFVITATLKGEDNAAFLNQCVLTLSETTGSTIIGSNSQTTSTGTAGFTIAFGTSGLKSLSCSCPASGSNPQKTGTLDVTVSSLKLKITSISPSVSYNQPYSSLSVFSVTISVYDTSGTLKETTRGPYSITLTISPSADVIGTWTGSTTSGDLILSSLRILNENSYTITASSSNIVSDSSSSISITKELHTITITSSNLTPTANFDFTLTVALTAEDSSAYAHSCLVVLSGSNLAGTLSKSILTGQSSYTVRVTLSGSHIITATSLAVDLRPTKTATITLNILANVLKFSSFSTTVFFK